MADISKDDRSPDGVHLSEELLDSDVDIPEHSPVFTVSTLRPIEVADCEPLACGEGHEIRAHDLYVIYFDSEWKIRVLSSFNASYLSDEMIKLGVNYGFCTIPPLSFDQINKLIDVHPAHFRPQREWSTRTGTSFFSVCGDVPTSVVWFRLLELWADSQVKDALMRNYFNQDWDVKPDAVAYAKLQQAALEHSNNIKAKRFILALLCEDKTERKAMLLDVLADKCTICEAIARHKIPFYDYKCSSTKSYNLMSIEQLQSSNVAVCETAVYDRGTVNPSCVFTFPRRTIHTIWTMVHKYDVQALQSMATRVHGANVETHSLSDVEHCHVNYSDAVPDVQIRHIGLGPSKPDNFLADVKDQYFRSDADVMRWIEKKGVTLDQLLKSRNWSDCFPPSCKFVPDFAPSRLRLYNVKVNFATIRLFSVCMGYLDSVLRSVETGAYSRQKPCQLSQYEFRLIATQKLHPATSQLVRDMLALYCTIPLGRLIPVTKRWITNYDTGWNMLSANRHLLYHLPEFWLAHAFYTPIFMSGDDRLPKNVRVLIISRDTCDRLPHIIFNYLHFPTIMKDKLSSATDAVKPFLVGLFKAIDHVKDVSSQYLFPVLYGNGLNRKFATWEVDPIIKAGGGRVVKRYSSGIDLGFRSFMVTETSANSMSYSNLHFQFSW